MKEVFVCVERSRRLFSNRLFAMSRAHRSVASVILLLTVCGGVSKVVSDEQPTSLKVKNAFLWPVSTLRLERALSSCHEVVTGCRGGPREMEAILAEIAVEAFTRYVDEILPRELEVERYIICSRSHAERCESCSSCFSPLAAACVLQTHIVHGLDEVRRRNAASAS